MTLVMVCCFPALQSCVFSNCHQVASSWVFIVSVCKVCLTTNQNDQVAAKGKKERARGTCKFARGGWMFRHNYHTDPRTQRRYSQRKQVPDLCKSVLPAAQKNVVPIHLHSRRQNRMSTCNMWTRGEQKMMPNNRIELLTFAWT